MEENGRQSPGVLAGGVPQTGTTTQKNPPLGGNRQAPRGFGDKVMASQEEQQQKIPPWPKGYLRKEQAD